MYNILVDFELSKRINLNKLGITFRKLTVPEKNKILNKINTVYFQNKKIINDLVKKYNILDELKVTNELLDYDKDTRDIIMFCYLGIKKGFQFNNERKIKNKLNNMIIIIIKKEVLLEYVSEEKFVKILSNILSLYDIYSKVLETNKKVRLDYSYILDDNILNPKEENYNIKLILNFIAVYKKNNGMMKYVELSEEYLIQLEKFISKLKKDEIRRFLNAIDLLYSEYTMVQNSIVSKVTIIESILIHEKEDIRRSFVLKAGLILKKYGEFNNNTSNKFIKDFLSYSYDMRSAIVHGNEEKIPVISNQIIQKNKYIKELMEKCNDNYNDRKKHAMYLADNILLIAVRSIIKCWIDNPTLIDFMKNNYEK